MLKHFILVLSLSFLIGAQASGHQIIDRPVPFPEKRKALTLEYMKDRYSMNRSDITITPKLIIIHWMAVDQLERCFQAFVPTLLRGGREDIAGSSLNVSAHFLVDRDGSIYRLMPEMWMARHVVGLNHCAIGIENVGGVKGVEDLTPKQLEANAYLVKYLKEKYPTIHYLAGHYEYRRFEGTSIWKEKKETPRTIKLDPGPKFMKALRQKVRALKFLPLP